MKILLLSGANLNMLGKRNPKFYGNQTLQQLNRQVSSYAKSLGNHKVICKQSNCEGKLINVLQRAKVDCAIINAGAYSHYSYALRDCIECLPYPVVEVHLSDIYQREEFRHTDVLKDVCKGYYYGKGVQSYFDAVDFLVKK